MKKAKPRRFLTIKDDTIGKFNPVLEIDVLKLQDGNVVHTICKGTGFHQGRSVNYMSASETCSTFRRCWINIFAGDRDYIHAGAGSDFSAKEFREWKLLKIALTECYERIWKIESVHSIIRSVYDKHKMDMTEKDLSLTFQAINDSPIGEEGISPTSLVFGVHLKLPGGGKRSTYEQSSNKKLFINTKPQKIACDSAEIEYI